MWSMKNKIAASAVKSVSPCEQGSCKNCDKPGLLVHPFRYSAFCSDDESIIERIPPLRPASGGSLPELTQSKYALRMMREGYIYVVLVRNGLKYIDSYYVRPSGRLMRFRETPPERKTSDMACQRMANSPNALMVAIDAPEEVSMSYWLFTPDPLSNSKEQELLSTAEELLSTGALQGFSPQRWVNQRQSDQYMLSPATISYFVLEYMVASQIAGYSIGQVPMIRALDEQPFPALCDSQDPPLPPAFTADQLGPFYQSRLNASLPVLRESVELLRSQDGVGIALQDPIGITQELNAWRNRAMEGLEEWMHTVDKFGVDNQWKYLAARQYADIREGVIAGRIRVAEQNALDASNHHIDQTLRELEALRGQQGSLDPSAVIEAGKMMRDQDPLGVRRAAIEQARTKTLESFERMESALDGNQNSILREFETLAGPCEVATRLRASDHLPWLASSMFKAALRFYDKNELTYGWAFAVQIGLSTNGMEADETSSQVIDEWWNELGARRAKDEHPDELNFAWRVFTLNQISLEEHVTAALADQKTLQQGDAVWETIALGNEAAGKAVELFDKANAALRACEEAGQVAWFKRSLLGVSMSWYAQWGRVLYRTATTSKLDQAYMNVLIKLMQLRMGASGRHIPVEGRFFSTSPGLSAQFWRGQMTKAIRTGVEVELSKGRAGGVYQARVMLMASAFESVNLIVKGRRLSANDVTLREGAEFIASGLALTGGVLALLEEASSWIRSGYGPRSLMGGQFQVWSGRLGIYGGFLSGSAGIAMAVLDAGSLNERLRKEDYVLAAAYGARSIVSGTAALLGITLSFAGAAPFLHALMVNSRVGYMRTILSISSSLSARLYARQALMLVLRVWGARLGWAAVALTVVITFMSLDDFKTWCEKSIFRIDKKVRGYPNKEAEILAILRLTNNDEE